MHPLHSRPRGANERVEATSALDVEDQIGAPECSQVRTVQESRAVYQKVYRLWLTALALTLFANVRFGAGGGSAFGQDRTQRAPV
jgi:hypothetical protein